MPISIDALKALAASGATPEMIIAVIEAQAAADNAVLAEKRKLERDRKRTYRASLGRRGQSGTSPDIADGIPDLNIKSATPTSHSGCDKENEEKATDDAANTTTILTSSLPSSDSQEKKEGVVGRARASSRGTRLPADWSPTENDWNFARELHGAAWITNEVPKFRDYWHARAGPGGVKLDWSATWRNWIRKAAEQGTPNGKARNSSSTITEAINGHIERFDIAAERSGTVR